jgi:hypothetical protein
LAAACDAVTGRLRPTDSAHGFLFQHAAEFAEDVKQFLDRS